MSQYKRLPKIKQQRRGDEFVSAVDRTIHWTGRNRRIVIPLALVVALTFGGIYGWRVRRQQKIFALNEALFRAETGASQREVLYGEILEKYRSLPASVAAPLALAKGAFEKGDFPAARESLQEADRVAPGFLKPVVTLAHAKVLMAAGETETALNLLRELSGGDPAVVGSYPRYLEATILMETGRKEEGEKILASLASEIEEDSFVRREARETLLKMKLDLDGGNP